MEQRRHGMPHTWASESKMIKLMGCREEVSQLSDQIQGVSGDLAVHVTVAERGGMDKFCGGEGERETMNLTLN